MKSHLTGSSNDLHTGNATSSSTIHLRLLAAKKNRRLRYIALALQATSALLVVLSATVDEWVAAALYFGAVLLWVGGSLTSTFAEA